MENFQPRETECGPAERTKYFNDNNEDFSLGDEL